MAEIQVNVTDAGGQTVTLLEGNTPRQWGNVCYNVHSGAITAPADFAAAAIKEFESAEQTIIKHDPRIAGLAEVKRYAGVIRFISDKHAECDERVIGRLINSPHLQTIKGAYKLNSGVGMTADTLRDTLRRTKMYFAENHWSESLLKLQDTSATINSKIKESNDDKGNISSELKRTLTLSQNAPQTLIVQTPIFDNEDPCEIRIELVPDVDERRLVFKCECWDLDRTIENFRTDIMRREEKRFADMGYLVLLLTQTD